jgi:hypothetical protein
VIVGQTFAHLIKTSSSFTPSNVYSLGIVIFIRGFKCLDVAGGRIYISRDVIFDEIVYPFSKLNPNTGARLRYAILLLPSQAQPHILPNHGAKLSDDPSSHL